MSVNLGKLPLPASTFSGVGGGRYSLNSNGFTLLAVALYTIASLSARFINKSLYTVSEYKFPYPFCTVFIQLIIIFVTLTIWSILKPIKRSYARVPAFKWDSNVAIKVAPLTIVYMCVVIFNPMFLQHVEVSTYHFSHSLSIAFSLSFSYLMLNVETAKQINSACIIIMFGVCVSSMGYLNFSMVGGFYALAWPAVVAIYVIYLKKTLVALRNDFWSVLQYNTLMAIAVLSPLVLLSGELGAIYSNVYYWDEFGFWLQLMITALTGFAVNASMLLLLLHTSPLSVAVASTTNTILQAFVAAIIFGNRITLLNVSGMTIALAGSCYYAYLRNVDPTL